MSDSVTFSQLRTLLIELGFRETRRAEGTSLKHRKSDTVFLFRPYQDSDQVQPAEIFLVQKMLDEKGLLEPKSFDVLLSKLPA